MMKNGNLPFWWLTVCSISVDDHMTEEEAKEMERRQEEILQSLSITTEQRGDNDEQIKDNFL